MKTETEKNDVKPIGSSRLIAVLADSETGYQLAKGFGRYAAKVIITGVIVLKMFGIILKMFGWGIDTTDESTWNRSNLKPLKDAATGVQYLSDGKGGLTPRINADGSLYR